MTHDTSVAPSTSTIAWPSVGGVLGEAHAILKGDGEKARTQRDAVTAFGVRCGSAALLYLSQVVLARWMGSNQYGIYVFVWTCVLWLGGLADLGLSITSIRLVPHYRETGNLALLRGLIRGSRLAALGVGAAMTALGTLILWLFHPLEDQYMQPAYLALFCLPLYAVTQVQDGIAKGFAWMAVSLVPPYILRPTLLLLAMVAAHFAGLPVEATSAAGAAIVATWVAGAFQTLLLNRRLDGVVTDGERRYSRRGSSPPCRCS
jgi:O-antigen/teichoic acid export membrane protein